MTNQDTQLKQTAAAIIRRVVKKTSLLVLLGAGAALLYGLLSGSGGRAWFVPFGILFGGSLGLLNFRWLAVAVERVYLKQGVSPAGANMAGVIINLLKLSAVFVILFVVIKWQLVHIFGLLIGLSLCFLAIIWEGLTVMTGGLTGGGK